MTNWKQKSEFPGGRNFNLNCDMFHLYLWVIFDWGQDLHLSLALSFFMALFIRKYYIFLHLYVLSINFPFLVFYLLIIVKYSSLYYYIHFQSNFILKSPKYNVSVEKMKNDLCKSFNKPVQFHFHLSFC